MCTFLHFPSQSFFNYLSSENSHLPVRYVVCSFLSMVNYILTFGNFYCKLILSGVYHYGNGLILEGLPQKGFWYASDRHSRVTQDQDQHCISLSVWGSQTIEVVHPVPNCIGLCPIFLLLGQPRSGPLTVPFADG